MSAYKNFLLTIFYLCALLALFAPQVLAHGGAPHGNLTHPTNGTNTTGGIPKPPTETTDTSLGATHMSSTVALFGALVAAAIFTI